MSTPALSRRVYRFGVFEVDLAKRELLRRGAPVRLQDQPFRVLCLLLQKPGEVVTREDLREALWPSDTYVDFEGGLNAALKRLRFALGDSARNPTFIVTLPKLGYRFVAPVAVADPDVAAAEPPARLPIPETIAQAKPGRRGRLLAIPCAAILLQQAVYWLFPLPPPRMISRTRLTEVGNAEPGPIATDGTRIFFCARRGARTYPVESSIRGGGAREVKAPFENSTIFDVSPDGTNFLLGSSDRYGDARKLWVWPLRGGVPRRFGNVVCGEAVWSPDGHTVAYTANGTALYAANSDGSAPRVLADRRAYHIVWAADGRKIRFSTWDPVMAVHSLWETDLSGTYVQQFFPGNEKAADTSVGFWLAGGKYFAFLRGSFPHQKLWMTREWPSFWRRSTDRPVQVSIGAEDTEAISGLGREGSRLASIGYWPDTKLHKLSPDGHSLAAESLFPAASNLHFSHDGRWVAYGAKDGRLWRCRADGTACLQLSSARTIALEPRWSPDDTQILFVDIQKGVMRRLYVVAAEGSSPPRALGPPDLVAGIADWTPEGKIILDMSGPSNDAPDYLYLVDPASGKTSLMPGSKGYHDPAWSRDSRWIATINSSSNQIFFYDLRQKVWRPGPAGTRIGYLYWSNRSNELFYQDLGEAGQPIYHINPVTGKKGISFSFAEKLEKDAVSCRLAGIASDDRLYAYIIASKLDLFLVDLDLP